MLQVQEGSKGNSSGGGSKGLSSGTKRGRDNSSAKRQGGIVGTGEFVCMCCVTVTVTVCVHVCMCVLCVCVYVCTRAPQN